MPERGGATPSQRRAAVPPALTFVYGSGCLLASSLMRWRASAASGWV